MIGATRAVRVWAYPEPADLRKGYNGLYGLVKSGLQHDPLEGDLFLFVNRRRSGCKILFWDGTGLVILMKRMERGRFAAPWERNRSGEKISMTAPELSLFLEGCAIVGRQVLSPPLIDFALDASGPAMF